MGSQSLADVKVGSLLSGGMDTSTIVSLWADIAAKRGSELPETFSIAWDNPRMSERPYIEAAAANAGVRSHILELRADDVWNATGRTINAVGQPLLGQDVIAQNFAFKLAHDSGAVVVLDGNGPDEVQGGLPYYEAQMVYERLQRMQYWDAARELLAIWRRYDLSLPRTIMRYAVSPILRNRNEARGLPRQLWLDQDMQRSSDTNWISSFTNEPSRDPSWMNAFLYRQTRHTNIPAVLMQSDRNSMSHSLEARYPFLDHRILELAFSLPAEYKVGFGRRKRLLFETAKDLLPSSILERRDKGKIVTLPNWMPLREHADEIREASRSSRLANLPGIKVKQLRECVDDYFAGRNQDRYSVWRIYTAALWAEQFGL